MIEHLVNEIECCLKNDLQIAALTMALTLPDICAKAYCVSENDGHNRNNRERYVRWYNDFVVTPAKERIPMENANAFVLSGELVYKLRCAMLHESNPTVKGAAENITGFSLLWRSASSRSRTAIERCTFLDAENQPQSLTVDIVSLCCEICRAALSYYRENKEKFSFDYRIISAPDAVAEMFGFNNRINI